MEEEESKQEGKGILCRSNGQKTKTIWDWRQGNVGTLRKAEEKERARKEGNVI